MTGAVVDAVMHKPWGRCGFIVRINRCGSKVRRPAVGENDVLVKVLACGVCRT